MIQFFLWISSDTHMCNGLQNDLDMMTLGPSNMKVIVACVTSLPNVIILSIITSVIMI